MSRSFELPEVEWATVGTVGAPGQRTFYLQARQGDRLVTLKLEKQQVAAVAQFLGEILSDLPLPGDVPDDSTLELVEPVLAEWAVGALQLGYDGSADRIVVLAEEIGLEEAEAVTGEPEEIGGEQFAGGLVDEEEAERAVGRFALTRTQAAAIARRGSTLVQAGRPTCSLCGHPIDPDGHSCPRTNGHRPPPS